MSDGSAESFDLFAAEKRREMNELIREINELKRYARHLNSCQTFAHPLERLPFTCNCGLERLLR